MRTRILQLALGLIVLSAGALLVACAGQAWLQPPDHDVLGLGIVLMATGIYLAFQPLTFDGGTSQLALESAPLLMMAMWLAPGWAMLCALPVAVAASLRSENLRLPARSRLYGVLVTALATVGVSHLSWNLRALGVEDPSGGVHIAVVVSASALLSLIMQSATYLQLQIQGISVRRFEYSVTLATVVFTSLSLVLLDPYRASGWLMIIGPTLFGGAWLSLRVINSEQLERRKREWFGRQMHRYAPHLAHVQERMDEIELGGEEIDVTVMFVDVRGFTAWSHQRSPREVFAQLNELLGALSQQVLATQGTLDKFTGDGLMAFWGAPVAQADHAARALDAARRLELCMKRINAGRLLRGQPAWEIGIGVASGCALVGNVGHTDRLDYTAIGDVANLAARLEGATKHHGSSCLVDSSTAQRAGLDAPQLRIELRGRGTTICHDLQLLSADRAA